MTTYFVHNTTRARHNRQLRMMAPEHGGHKQFIGGAHRLILNRPIAFTEEQIQLHLSELKQKAKYGQIEVRDGEGRKIDLDTMAASGLVMPPPALVKTRLDSIANDDPHMGRHLPQFQGGLPEVSEDSNDVPDLIAGVIREEGQTENKSSGATPQKGGGGKKGNRGR